MTVKTSRPLFVGLFIVGLLALFWSPVHAAKTSGDSVIRVTDHKLTTKSGDNAKAVVFDFRADRIRLVTISTLAMKPDYGRGSTGLPSGISVGHAADLPEIRRRSQRELLLINGGFSGSQTSRPIGLLISDGRTISLPNFQIQKGDPESSCRLRQKDRYRFSGVVCVGNEGAIKMGRLEEVKLEECEEAIQAGPVLVESGGQIGVCEPRPEDAPSLRTALCQRGDQTSAIIVHDPVQLFDFAKWLAAPIASGGLGCSVAVNLSGDTSTGAVYLSGPNKKIKYGPGTFPQASLIAVFPR